MTDHPIPAMTDTSDKNWSQPDRAEIQLDGDTATMTTATFAKLRDYTGSQLSGMFKGKMWKASATDKSTKSQRWLLYWLDVTPDKNALGLKRNEIVVSDAPAAHVRFAKIRL